MNNTRRHSAPQIAGPQCFHPECHARAAHPQPAPQTTQVWNVPSVHGGRQFKISKNWVIGILIVLLIGAAGSLSDRDNEIKNLKEQAKISSSQDASYSPATHSHHRAPNAGERQELRYAQRASGSGYTCHLEWDGPAYPGYEAICSHKPATKVVKAIKVCSTKIVAGRDRAACVRLYLRPAQHRGSISNPAGPALVSECLDQYRGTELHYCLTQPQI